MNKNKILDAVLSYLHLELSHCEQAANNAHLAATDDQSVAETQYDTLAIESAYLAEGQSRRLIEFKESIKRFTTLQHQILNEIKIDLSSDLHLKDKSIGLGSLVQLSEDETVNHWFFIAPAAAGFKGIIGKNSYTVITPQSPMGKTLMGKKVDDEIKINVGLGKVQDDIIHIL